MLVKSRKLLTTALLGAALLSTHAFADGYDAAVRALEAGNYQAARTGLTVEAEKGHAKAQRRLGEMYHQGEGTAPDPIMAVKWLTLAYLNGEVELLPTLETLRDGMTEEEIVEGEQAALQWLEDANRVIFADDDADALYEQQTF